MSIGFDKFISGLEKIYGRYDHDSKKFLKKSNSDIARDLFYSDSQFSRLINQTASEGEYQRANKIIKRYQENISLTNKLDSRRKDGSLLFSIIGNPLAMIISIGSLILAGYVGYTINDKDSKRTNDQASSTVHMDHMLRWAFESSNVKSYTQLDDLPEDCNFPCYRLQGQWKLKDRYKLPVFGEQRGFHYLATDVNMYARCMSEIDSTGHQMEGYEYQKHEIWYDVTERPVDYFTDMNTDSQLKDSYNQMIFSENKDFMLVAHIHTFFRNSFFVEEKNIHREGKVIGRYIEFEDMEILAGKIKNISSLDLEQAIQDIVDNRLEDFSRPVECSNAKFEKPTVYQFEDNDTMIYECKMTTGRLPLGYVKKYVLVDQVIKNACWVENN